MNRESLIINGKYNRRAIITRAWMYVNNPFNTQYRNNFNGALKAAWTDAKLEMDEYNIEKLNRPFLPKKGLRATDLYWTRDMINGCVTR